MPMRIAYLTNSYPATSHTFIRREIRALERQGLTVVRYALSPGRDLVDSSDVEEVRVTRYVKKQTLVSLARHCFSGLCSWPSGLFRAVSISLRLGYRSERGFFTHLAYVGEALVLAAWCKQDRIDHLHAHFGTNPASIAMLSNVIAGIPYSFTLHGPDEFDNPRGNGLAEKVRHAAFTITVSSFGRSQLMRWCAPDVWHKIKVVHCGLDRAEFDSSGREIAHIQGRLLCVARFAEQKGHLILLEALAALKREGWHFSLTLVGDGPLRALIERRISELGLISHVQIAGWMSGESIKHELATAHAVVLPSFAEGLPVVLMEAMAAGCPVIATYIAGIPELVISGETGYLVPAGNVDKLATAIRSILSDSDYDLSEMGSMAKRIAFERHQIDISATKLIRLFRAHQSLSSKHAP